MAKRLDLSRKPAWIKVDDELSLLVRPFDLSDLRTLAGPLAALAPAQGGAQDGAQGGAQGGTPDLDAFDASLEVLLELIDRHVEDWTVVDPDDRRVPVTREAALALVSQEPALCGGIVAAVLGPGFARAAAVADEGNGCAPSRSGCSAGAPSTAAPAPGAATTARKR